MADKSVGELIAAQSVTPTDLFLLEQNGTAKKLTGQILENWLVSFADGHGGIQSIVKKSTSGLVDTYRITLSDTTTFDFMVTNGKSIKSISKASTSGLVDTYRIAFNDGTSSTFTVTNGEKGDKGDNQYVWIKYASQKPTATSHSFGDVADDWIGIYSGSSGTAPTDWTQYEWFKIKGEKGYTGEPATLVSSSVTYQVGDSGTIIPSGSWQASVPSVTPGKFLWTREITQFNTGNPIVKYSVSRFGIDGAGAVSTVAGVAPDANGNVPLDASNVKALHIGGGTMEGAINMNGQPISGLNAPTANDQAANMGFVNQQVNKAAPYNYAQNSDFTQFVAQAGIGGKHGKQSYAGDRWILDSGKVTGEANENGNGYRNITLNGTIRQKISNPPAAGTAGVEMISGTATVTYENGEVTVTSNGGVIGFVKLFPGEYTADNMPKAQPKGYGTELLECRRYYQELDYNALGNGYTSSGGGSAVLIVNTGIQMRIVPTLVGEKNITVRADGTDYSAQFNNISMYEYGNGAVCEIIVNGTIPAKQPAAFFTTGKLALSADL